MSRDLAHAYGLESGNALPAPGLVLWSRNNLQRNPCSAARQLMGSLSDHTLVTDETAKKPCGGYNGA